MKEIKLYACSRCKSVYVAQPIPDYTTTPTTYEDDGPECSSYVEGTLNRCSGSVNLFGTFIAKD